MPVAPAYGNGGGGFGFDGNSGWWIILLLLIFGNGMFGGFGGGMWPMMGMGAGMDLYPWLNNSQHINDGFRDQQIQTTLGSIQNGITSVTRSFTYFLWKNERYSLCSNVRFIEYCTFQRILSPRAWPSFPPLRRRSCS